MAYYLVIGWAISFVIYIVSIQRLRARYELHLKSKETLIRLYEEELKKLRNK